MLKTIFLIVSLRLFRACAGGPYKREEGDPIWEFVPRVRGRTGGSQVVLSDGACLFRACAGGP